MTSPSQTPANANIAGDWEIILVSSTGNRYDYEFALQQTNTQLSAKVLDDNGNTVMDLSGTVTSNNAALTIQANSLTFTVTAAISGSTMAGTYTAFGESGTFTGTLYPSLTSSAWDTNPPGTFSANLNEDKLGNVTGSITLSGQPYRGSPCSVTLTVTGGKAGKDFTLLSPDVTDFYVEGLMTDGTGKHLTGTFNYHYQHPLDCFLRGQYNLYRP
jgi:hypothetical protein